MLDLHPAAFFCEDLIAFLVFPCWVFTWPLKWPFKFVDGQQTALRLRHGRVEILNSGLSFVNPVTAEFVPVDTRYKSLSFRRRDYKIANGRVTMDAIVGYRVVGPLTVHRKIKDVEEFIQLALTKVVDEVLSQQYSDQVLGLLEREEEPLSCEPTVPWDCNEGAEIPLEVLLKAPNAVLKVIPSQKLNAVSVTKLQNVPVHVLQHATVEVLQKLPIPTLIGLGSVPPHVLQSAPLSVLTDMPVTKLEKMGNVPFSVLQLAPLDVLLRAPVYVLESTPVELSLEVPVESLLRGQATHINGLTRMQTTRASINGNSAPAPQGLQADFSWVKKVNKKLELFGVKASWVQFTNVDIAAFSLQSNGMAE